MATEKNFSDIMFDEIFNRRARQEYGGAMSKGGQEARRLAVDLKYGKTSDTFDIANKIDALRKSNYSTQDIRREAIDDIIDRYSKTINSPVGKGVGLSGSGRSGFLLSASDPQVRMNLSPYLGIPSALMQAHEYALPPKADQPSAQEQYYSQERNPAMDNFMNEVKGFLNWMMK